MILEWPKRDLPVWGMNDFGNHLSYLPSTSLILEPKIGEEQAILIS